MTISPPGNLVLLLKQQITRLRWQSFPCFSGTSILTWLNSGFSGAAVLAERGTWDIMRTNPITQDLFCIRRSGLLDSIIFWKIFYRGALFQRFNSQIIGKFLLNNYANLANHPSYVSPCKSWKKKKKSGFSFARTSLTTEALETLKSRQSLKTHSFWALITLGVQHFWSCQPPRRTSSPNS